MPAFKDLTDQRFGRLLVKKIADRRRYPSGKSYVFWECLCDCGNTCKVMASTLNSKQGNITRSCGCYRLEILPIIRANHWKSEDIRPGKFPEGSIWESMIKRCYNTNSISYKHYGARGITVCERWMKFEFFYTDVGPRPGPEYSLDRKDNNANYSCGKCDECIANNWTNNVTWATREQQARNKRTTRWITFQGTTLCLKEWAIKLDIDVRVLWWRLKHWTLDRAMTEPLHYQPSTSNDNQIANILPGIDGTSLLNIP